MTSGALGRSQVEPKAAIALTACLVAVLVAALFASRGHLSLDEGAYHMMARDFAASGGFALSNGFEEFASPELTFPVLREHGGRLVSQYPPFYVVIAAPFYWLLGYKGLILLSALAFAGVVWLTFRLARRLLGDSNLALNAALILIFATYAWEYSQAAMPHTLSMLPVLGAACLAAGALADVTAPRSRLAALGAGLLVGVSVGIRLDVSFVLPALVVPFLFLVPWRPGHALAIALGTLPGLALLAAVNHAKFGIASPFTYGEMARGYDSSILPYVALAAVGACGLAVLWAATRPAVRRRLQPHGKAVGLGLLTVLALAAAVPAVRAQAGQFADGLYKLVVDLRAHDLAYAVPGLTRGPGGGFIYMGGLKKSLLQSCPYLVVLVIPLVGLIREKALRPAFGLLFLVPASFVGVYGYFAWHGGLALNLRYFLPILPFTSILAAYAWRSVTQDLGPQGRRACAWAAGLLIAAYLAFVLPRPLALAQEEALYLTLPLALAAGLLALLAAALLGRTMGAGRLRPAAALLFTLALTWSGLVAFAHDLPHSAARRHMRAAFLTTIAPMIRPDSLFFVSGAGPFFGLFDRPGVRIAIPDHDDYRDFEALIRFHRGAGRPVYAWLGPRMRGALEARGLLSRLRWTSLYEHEAGRLIEITGLAPP